MFQINNKGKLLPMGAADTYIRGTYYCSKTSTSELNGAACTAEALTDENFWKNMPR